MHSVIAIAVAVVREILQNLRSLQFKVDSPHFQNWTGNQRHRVSLCPPTLSFAYGLGKLRDPAQNDCAKGLVDICSENLFVGILQV